MTSKITKPVTPGGIVRGTPFSGAEFSPCERYRYRLWRVGRFPNGCDEPLTNALFPDRSPPLAFVERDRPRLVAFVMLNPSTADERALDPTLRRCQGFARAWGYDGFVVANIFAWRATDPKRLPTSREVVGPSNEAAIESVARDAEIVVCGWGAGAPDSAFRSSAIEHARLALGSKARHLGLTKHGHPRHPLYLPKSVTPQRMED